MVTAAELQTAQEAVYALWKQKEDIVDQVRDYQWRIDLTTLKLLIAHKLWDGAGERPRYTDVNGVTYVGGDNICKVVMPTPETADIPLSRYKDRKSCVNYDGLTRRKDAHLYLLNHDALGTFPDIFPYIAKHRGIRNGTAEANAEALVVVKRAMRIERLYRVLTVRPDVLKRAWARILMGRWLRYHRLTRAGAAIRKVRRRIVQARRLLRTAALLRAQVTEATATEADQAAAREAEQAVAREADQAAEGPSREGSGGLDRLNQETDAERQRRQAAEAEAVRLTTLLEHTREDARVKQWEIDEGSRLRSYGMISRHERALDEPTQHSSQYAFVAAYQRMMCAFHFIARYYDLRYEQYEREQRRKDAYHTETSVSPEQLTTWRWNAAEGCRRVLERDVLELTKAVGVLRRHRDRVRVTGCNMDLTSERMGNMETLLTLVTAKHNTINKELQTVLDANKPQQHGADAEAEEQAPKPKKKQQWVATPESQEHGDGGFTPTYLSGDEEGPQPGPEPMDNDVGSIEDSEADGTDMEVDTRVEESTQTEPVITDPLMQRRFNGLKEVLVPAGKWGDFLHVHMYLSSEYDRLCDEKEQIATDRDTYKRKAEAAEAELASYRQANKKRVCDAPQSVTSEDWNFLLGDETPKPLRNTPIIQSVQQVGELDTTQIYE